MRPRVPFRAGPWDTQRPAGAETGNQLTFERTPTLDIQTLVNSLMADPHGLIIGEVDLETLRYLLRTPRQHPAPIPRRGLFRPFHGPGAGPSTGGPVRAAHLTRQPVLDVVMEPLWLVARSPAWDAEPPTRPSTGPPKPDTRASRHESLRCGAAPERSSKGHGPTGEPSHGHRLPGLSGRAISSRSSNDRYRPDRGASSSVGMPPP